MQEHILVVFLQNVRHIEYAWVTSPSFHPVLRFNLRLPDFIKQPNIVIPIVEFIEHGQSKEQDFPVIEPIPNIAFFSDVAIVGVQQVESVTESQTVMIGANLRDHLQYIVRVSVKETLKLLLEFVRI